MPRLCHPPCVCHPPIAIFAGVGSVQQSDRPSILLLERRAADSRYGARISLPGSHESRPFLHCQRPGGGQNVTWMSQSRDRTPSRTPDRSVSRTQCRLHARGAEGEGWLSTHPWRRPHHKSLYHNHFAPLHAHCRLLGTGIADYRSESVRSGPAAWRLDGVARFVRRVVIALSPMGNWRWCSGDAGPDSTRRIAE